MFFIFMNKEQKYQITNFGHSFDVSLFKALGQISRVVFASDNERKLEAAEILWRSLAVQSGADILLPESRRLGGDEAPWERADLVVVDKLREAATEEEKAHGSHSLISASDVVFAKVVIDSDKKMRLEQQYNMSRYDDQDGALRKQFLSDDLDFFTNPNGSLVSWDVVAGFYFKANGSPGLKALLGNRHVAKLKPLSKLRIRQAYGVDQMARTKRINARLDIVGGFKDCVEAYGIIPLNQTIADVGFREIDDWWENIYWRDGYSNDFNRWKDAVEWEVASGAPFWFKDRLDKLLEFNPYQNQASEYVLL